MRAAMIQLHHIVQTVLRWLCIFLFTALALILLLNVVMRVMNDLSIFLAAKNMMSASAFVKKLVPITSMHWFDEIVELCFAWLVFYGAAALWGLKGHFSVGDWISARSPNHSLRAFYKLFVSLLSATFIGVFFWFSFALILRSTELSTVFQMPKSFMYSSMTIGSGIMLIYSLTDVWLDLTALFRPASSGSREQTSQSM